MSTRDDSYVKTEFSVRIVVCDYYLARPIPSLDVIYSDFRGSDIKQVPVFRIFGPASDGHKACMHVHGVFPYFYIPCPVSNPQPQFLYQIAASLDKALNIALKQATSANQHVYKISLVKGLPFYGFHDKDHLYLKIFLYSPGLIKQAVELCSNGAILGQQLQPHESHINFTLQFFIDFNLFGMSNIDLQHVRFRKIKLSQNSDEPLENSEDLALKPESSCYYEVDCIASHIINRQRVGKGDGIENPGLEEVWNQELERRKQLNMSLASKSLSQGRLKSLETESHYKFEQMCLVKLTNIIDKPVVLDTENENLKEEINYPAESVEGSQLFNAVDVSVHLPEKSFSTSLNVTLKRDEDLIEDINNTVVDETLALNSSLSMHYSQVLLNNEDLELLEMLEDMDEKPTEEDSFLATPANVDNTNEDDDAEYSQIFDEDTLLIEEPESHTSTSLWNDSFWSNANIAQLDGTCDDDHTKKVRKRKMRPFKLGLSKFRSSKNNISNADTKNNLNSAMMEVDEINVSRETIETIPHLHLKKSHKKENDSCAKQYSNLNSNKSVIELVDELSSKYTSSSQSEATNAYDLKNKYKPLAGPSNIKIEECSIANNQEYTSSDEMESSVDSNKSGIISFYNISKFNITLEDQELSTSDFKSKIDNYEVRTVPGNNLDEIMKDVEKTNDKIVTVTMTPKIKPPTKAYINTTLDQYKIHKIKNVEPYYSDYKDVGDKVEIGQMVLKVQSKLSRDQKPYEKVLDTVSIEEWRQLLFMETNEINEESSKPDTLKTLLAGSRKCTLEPINKPPTNSQICNWMKEQSKVLNVEVKIDNEITKNIDDLDHSQALGLIEDEIDNSISLENKDSTETSLQITMQPDGSYLCFGSGEKQNQINSLEIPLVDVDFLTLMLVEVHTSVRGDLHPDPLIDTIQAIFVTITNDCPLDHFLTRNMTEILVVDNSTPPKYLDKCIFDSRITYLDNESELLSKLIELVKLHDPDIMTGYEIEMGSWGYILERSQVLGLDIVKEISRITEKHRQKRWRNDESDFEGRIIGRVMFNVWRLFRHELALSSYSFENCMYEILKERVPAYSYAKLSEWWCDESRILRWIPVEYYLMKLSGTVRMMEKLDIINRTSELARLFGLQWWEVLSRGSQFRVESLMLRAARPLNLVALSPTVKQRAAMRAPECLPLIFEPESRFYSDPVIVLDFQSLYPSMMIAYNYCFSTCIGRVQNVNGDSAYEFGAWRLRIPKSKLESLVKNGAVHWSPVGVGFVKVSVRRGVLPALLRRILAARQAVKKSMKLQTDDAVKRAMHSRQLGLKLIANVTYGYTAANFSGRMPCVEVGDSVVAKGRETLERAIQLVRSSTQWNVKVVYGDTDSMFVLVPGASRAEAFRIGQEIADAVTADNPSPVALKLEKVYQPCILQTKKRYVGYMYESPDQEKPIYEAKGIETVRRDGCPAGVKLLQRCLCELFESGDVSRVKSIVMGTLSRLVAGSLPPQDLFFTREYHGPTGYRPGAVAPPNEIAKRLMSRDRRSVPRGGWRVAWGVCAGAPATPLVRLARTPRELAREPARPHVAYYATRVLLPPLHRCLSLLGLDVFKWWREVGWRGTVEVGGIARYMRRERDPRVSHAAQLMRHNAAVTHLHYCNTICASCCGYGQSEATCENMECPVLWRRLAAKQTIDGLKTLITD